MASLFSSIRSALGDPMWLIKLAIAVIILYLEIEVIPSTFEGNNLHIMVINMVIQLFFFGCAVVTMSRNTNNQLPIFPGFTDMIEIVKKAFLGFFVTLPMSIFAGLSLYLLTMFPMEDIVKYIIYVLLAIFIIPFSILNVLLFSVRGRFLDAFNFNIISQSFGNVIVGIILLILQSILIFGISYVCLYFFFVQMFSAEHITIRILTYTFSIIGYFVSAINISDMYASSIPPLDNRN